jgi:hypothetical protein
VRTTDTGAAPARRPAPAATLPLIRVALLAGVLIFGAVTWWLHRQGRLEVVSAGELRPLRQAGAVVWLAAIVAEVVLFVVRLRARERDPARLQSQRIMAWSAGEAVALFGGVYYFRSADPQWFVYGLIFFLGVLMVFPAREA